MTFSAPLAFDAGLVLLGHGPAGQVRALLHHAGPGLAAALAQPWSGLLEGEDPAAALQAGRPGLVALARDPGQSLANGGHWAEALGAWRQPVLVLLTAEQVGWGLATASAALLRQHDVPLLGLVQWGQAWDGDLRRREGLPWLGWWAGDPDGAEAAVLRQALRVRGRQLAADLAG